MINQSADQPANHYKTDDFQLICGDALHTIKTLSAASIDCVISSPPYWRLRDYGYPEQWGLESNFYEYLEKLWLLMDEIWRVLKPGGTVWINLGDTYSSKTKLNKAVNVQQPRWNIEDINANVKKTKAFPDKCLLLIPHRFAIGCMERNWIIRNDIVWAKVNALPESVKDRLIEPPPPKGRGILFLFHLALHYCNAASRFYNRLLELQS